MSVGTPVIASDIPVLKEVLPKDGVFFFKNGDKDAMIATIEAVLADLPNATALARRGGEEVRRIHRWDVVAKVSLEALQHACLSPNEKISKDQNGGA